MVYLLALSQLVAHVGITPSGWTHFAPCHAKPMVDFHYAVSVLLWHIWPDATARATTVPAGLVWNLMLQTMCIYKNNRWYPSKSTLPSLYMKKQMCVLLVFCLLFYNIIQHFLLPFYPSVDFFMCCIEQCLLVLVVSCSWDKFMIIEIFCFWWTNANCKK